MSGIGGSEVEPCGGQYLTYLSLLLASYLLSLLVTLLFLAWFGSSQRMVCICVRNLLRSISADKPALPCMLLSSWMVHCPRKHRLLHEFDNKLGSDYLGEGT